EMLQNPPFTNQMDADERATRREGRRQESRALLGPEALRESLAVCREALDAAPDDWMIRMHLANLLAESGELGQAAEHHEAVVGQVPHSSLAHYKRAAVSLRMGKYEEANAGFRA